MLQLLIEQPLLLLFLVAAIGYPLGQIKVRGSSLGVAAVLFVGLAFGALDPDLKLPAVIYEFGLVLFVYTIGLGSGPAFVRSLGRDGLRNSGLVIGALAAAAVLAVVLARLFGLSGPIAAGAFAGGLTNTPALAGVIENLKASAGGDALNPLLNEPVVGYSISYPFGVLGMILAIALARRVWRVDYRAEARQLRELGATGEPLQNYTVLITQPAAADKSIQELVQANDWDVIFSRIRRDGQLSLASAQSRLQPGDLVSIIGHAEELQQVTAFLGQQSDARLEADVSEIIYRRIFVSNPKVIGRRLRDLDLAQRFGALVTRVRRGDMQILPHADTVLEPGDMVRVVVQRDRLDAVSEYFGDSYRALSEIDILTFSLGLTLGLLLGSLPVPLPGGITLRLGIAGGPLIVGLILGATGRTGRIVWSLPYSANVLLRQLGLVLFLAGVGTRSGYAFVTTLAQGNAWGVLAAGALITATAALLILWIGRRVFKMPLSILSGILSGLQTQPAVLGFAQEQAGNDLPNIGYTAVYPAAMIAKILLAQLVLILLR